jgi:lipopolysaccharide transport system ATP-binding protein
MITVPNNSRNEVLVRAENVSKKFCRSLKKSLWYGMQDIAHEVNPFTRRRDNRLEELKLRNDEFLAVNDVSFELRRGECLGLIGRNGAGKTTLLKMLNGLLKPDQGRIEMHGRVGALIALGAGFNPILTGRENVYINGSILGLTRYEINDRLDDIVDFADIGDFIDAPVQSYSSGMQVRLGFAVATALDPDVLILDEVLAVGDAAFRAKCYNRIGKLQKQAAVIFVSHSMQQVSQVCSTVLMLKSGQVKWLGDVPGGIEAYLCENSASEAESLLTLVDPVRKAELQFGPSHEVHHGEFVTVKLEIELSTAMPCSSMRIVFYNSEDIIAAEWNSKFAGIDINLLPGSSTVELEIGPIHLSAGVYKIGVALNDATGVFMPFWSLRQHSISVQGDVVGLCNYQLSNSSFTCGSNLATSISLDC